MPAPLELPLVVPAPPDVAPEDPVVATPLPPLSVPEETLTEPAEKPPLWPDGLPAATLPAALALPALPTPVEAPEDPGDGELEHALTRAQAHIAVRGRKTNRTIRISIGPLLELARLPYSAASTDALWIDD